jgi:flagellar motor switch protein FliN/FliY
MNMTDTNQSETLLEDLGDDMIIDQGDVADVASTARGAIPQMMRKIPVT